MESERDGTPALSQHEPPLGAVWIQLAKYLIGELDPEERANVEHWIAADRRRQAMVAKVKANWAMKSTSLKIIDVEAALATVMERADVMWSRDDIVIQAGLAKRPGVDGLGRLGGFSGHPLRRGMWYAVAGLVLGVVATLAGRYSAGTAHPRNAGQSPVSTYVTVNGQRATVMLPDGNTVALNVGSRLEVPVDYLAGNRTLRLTGEAIFTITHHEEVPLAVMSGPTTARVLGTTFLVRHYATDSVTIVAVRDGKVTVQAGNRLPMVLAATRQVSVGLAGIGQAQGVDLTEFGFATGVLTINGSSFSEAIAELDRWYDADIRLGDAKLATRKVNGEFMTGSLAELQEELELAFNVRGIRAGRILTLYPR